MAVAATHHHITRGNLTGERRTHPSMVWAPVHHDGPFLNGGQQPATRGRRPV